MAENDNYQEVEVKLHVSNFNAVIPALKRMGAELAVPRVFERNVRYDTVNRSLSAQDIVLRLRQDNGVRLTFKDKILGDAITRGVHQRFEAEVSVSDFDTMNLILERLGFKPYMTYEKYRTTYDFNEIEIVLDEMPYGNFIEIEAPDEAAITPILEQLGLQSAPKSPYSYSKLFAHVKRNLKLDFNDLTFANFVGINVPIEAFIPPVIGGEW
ncbi:MAG: class IV adenylate cyclase [Phototrophicaceae bacterium]|jgi:adenylate cyclase class 2